MSGSGSVRIVALSLLAVAVLGLLVHLPSRKIDARLEFWRPSAAVSRRLNEVQRERLARLPPESSRTALTTAFMELNLAAAEGEPLTGERHRWIASRYEREKRAFLGLHGERGYLAVGALLAGHFEGHLLALSKRWAEAEGGEAVLVGPHDDRDLQALRALSGRFVEKAIHSGLLAPGRSADPDLGLVARCLFLQNWVLGLGIKAPDRRLAVEENALVLKWKVEAAEHLSLNRRIELARKIPLLERSYPATYVVGVLLALEGPPEDAAAAFRECVDSREMGPQAREWLIALRDFSSLDAL